MRRGQQCWPRFFARCWGSWLVYLVHSSDYIVTPDLSS